MKPKGTRDIRWTEDEIRRVAEMRARKIRVAVIAVQLGWTIHSVKGFLSRCSILREQGIDVYLPRSAHGPAQQTIEDRTLRLLASQRMSTTALLMGDPPPGYSARDRRAS